MRDAKVAQSPANLTIKLLFLLFLLMMLMMLTFHLLLSLSLSRTVHTRSNKFSSFKFSVFYLVTNFIIFDFFGEQKETTQRCVLAVGPATIEILRRERERE